MEDFSPPVHATGRADDEPVGSGPRPAVTGDLTKPSHHSGDLLAVTCAERRAVADLNPAAAFSQVGPVNYQAFTNDSLTLMYEAVRGALAADDALKRQESETRFRVRETPAPIGEITPLTLRPKCSSAE
jgi:hypothetical protein